MRGKLLIVASKLSMHHFFFRLAVRAMLINNVAAGPVPVSPVALIGKSSSVHGWACGHSLGSEDAINFAQVHDVNCMIEKFPLEKANEAYNHMMSNKARFRAVLIMT